jgi:hypothetical protein
MSVKITVHISFFYIEERIKYINKIIDETNKYEYETDIYIHTSNNIDKNVFNKYTNGTINIIYHDLSNIHPYYLTWKCRDLLAKQMNDYDIFMYIEDDILVPYKAIKYWLKYNEKLIAKKYNLGFVRIEIDNDNVEYITDLPKCQLSSFIKLDEQLYAVNDVNPYCAFWIYNKTEFKNFVNSKFYNLNNIPNFYGIREKSAIGLHGLYHPHINWYINTVIPICNDKLIDDCKIYHYKLELLC